MSEHYCEAMIEIPAGYRATKTFRNESVYSGCGQPNAELHHRLTRARGGLILDAAKETYHHMWLCREHHQYAHDSDKGIENGLLLEGYVTTDSQTGRPVYDGPDEYLKERYPARM